MTNEEQVSHLWELFAEDMRLQTQAAQNRTIKISEYMEARRNRKRTR